MENPQIMEDFIKALGAEADNIPMRNECCGGYVLFGGQGIVQRKNQMP